MNDKAVSEIIGTMFLLAICIVVASVVYAQVLPIDFPKPESYVKIMGYLENDEIKLEHVGGIPLYNYDIIVGISVFYNDDTIIGGTVFHYDEIWEIGGIITIPISLTNRGLCVFVLHYSNIVFEGKFQGV